MDDIGEVGTDSIGIIQIHINNSTYKHTSLYTNLTLSPMYSTLPPQYYQPSQSFNQSHIPYPTQSMYNQLPPSNYTAQNNNYIPDSTYTPDGELFDDSDYEQSLPTTPTNDSTGNQSKTNKSINKNTNKKTAGNGSKSVSNFIAKIYKMVNDVNTDHIVCWSDHGDSFIVKNEFEFATIIMKSYFRHQNFSSFVRQLNFYGFHKRSHSASAAYTTFSHIDFKRDTPNTLYRIQRKSTDIQGKNTNLKDHVTALQLQVNELNNIVNDQQNKIDRLIHIVTRYMNNGSTLVFDNTQTVPSNNTNITNTTPVIRNADSKPVGKKHVSSRAHLTKSESIDHEPHSSHDYYHASSYHHTSSTPQRNTNNGLDHPILPEQNMATRQRSHTWQSSDTHTDIPDSNNNQQSSFHHTTDPLLHTLPNLPGINDYNNPIDNSASTAVHSDNTISTSNNGGHAVSIIHAPNTPSNKRKQVESLQLLSPAEQYDHTIAPHELHHNTTEHIEWFENTNNKHCGEHKELELLSSHTNISTPSNQKRRTNPIVTITSTANNSIHLHPITPNNVLQYNSLTDHNNNGFMQSVNSPLFHD